MISWRQVSCIHPWRAFIVLCQKRSVDSKYVRNVNQLNIITYIWSCHVSHWMLPAVEVAYNFILRLTLIFLGHHMDSFLNTGWMFPRRQKALILTARQHCKQIGLKHLKLPWEISLNQSSAYNWCLKSIFVVFNIQIISDLVYCFFVRYLNQIFVVFNVIQKYHYEFMLLANVTFIRRFMFVRKLPPLFSTDLPICVFISTIIIK